jgi:hypothetical protein
MADASRSRRQQGEGERMKHFYSFAFLAMMTSGFYLATHSPNESTRHMVGMLIGFWGLGLFVIAWIVEISNYE